MSTLSSMKARGIGQTYSDRLDKLFHSYFSQDLRRKPVSDFDGHDIWAHLNSKAISAGNARLLRPFVRRVFSDYYDLAGGLNKLEMAYGPESLEISGVHGVPKEIANWQEADFIDRLDILLEEKKYRQQAMCLRLFFSLSDAPLSALMAATWSQIGTIELSDSLGDCGPNLLVWDRKPNRRGRIRFHGKSRSLLKALFLEAERVIKKITVSISIKPV